PNVEIPFEFYEVYWVRTPEGKYLFGRPSGSIQRIPGASVWQPMIHPSLMLGQPGVPIQQNVVTAAGAFEMKGLIGPRSFWEPGGTWVYWEVVGRNYGYPDIQLTQRHLHLIARDMHHQAGGSALDLWTRVRAPLFYAPGEEPTFEYSRWASLLHGLKRTRGEQ